MIRENADKFHLVGLSVHRAENEEDAIEKSYRLYSDLCRDVETVEEEEDE